ncbi:MAG: efflux RND transporter permease subunit [Nitrospiraceae bacterium]
MQVAGWHQPLAWTNNLAIAMCAVLAITLVPACLPTFIRGKIFPEQKHPVSRRPSNDLAVPFLRLALRQAERRSVSPRADGQRRPALSTDGVGVAPPLYEGMILYMPTTLPGLSITEAGRMLQIMDQKLRSFPEVDYKFGKAGRAETSTDPAPFSMIEVVVELKPKDQWRPGLSYEGLIDEMDRALQFPGVTNAWTMPIKARIDMLTTGVRTPVGSRSSDQI